MGSVAVIGSEALVSGYRLAGVTVLVAEDAAAVRAAWRALPADIALVIATEAAAAALPQRDEAQWWPLLAVICP